MVSTSVTLIGASLSKPHTRVGYRKYMCYVVQCTDLMSHAFCRMQSVVEFSLKHH